MKILLIEDNIQTIELITYAFGVGWHGSEIIVAHNGKHGLEIFEKKSPDCVLLDLGLPDISGFDVLKRVRSFSKIPIIIITAKDSEEDIVKGLEMGADDYLVKPFKTMELFARIKAVNRRVRAGASKNITWGPMKLSSTNQLVIGDKTSNLTPTEGRILNLFMANGDQLVTYEDLAETIWGTSYPNSNDAVRVYIRRLRLKIAVNNKLPCLIVSIPGLGYSLKVPH